MQQAHSVRWFPTKLRPSLVIICHKGECVEAQPELLGLCGDEEDGGAVGEPSLLFCSSIDSEELAVVELDFVSRLPQPWFWGHTPSREHSEKMPWINPARICSFFMCLSAILTKGRTGMLVNLSWTSSRTHIEPNCLLGESAGWLPLLPSRWNRTDSKLRH